MFDIKVCTGAKCAVAISEINTNYLKENSTAIAKNKFRYSDTVSIDVLQLNKSTGQQIQNPVFTIRDSKINPVQLQVSFDGWFTICHIVIPNKQWFDKEFEKSTDSALNLYDTIYYSDGAKIYKYINNEITEVSVGELINRNIEGTTISIVKKDYVSVCFLRKCYVNLCQQLFNLNIISECSNNKKDNCDLIFQSDLIWMALNVIQYMTELNQLAEAERIIEQLGRGCNGLCKQTFEQLSKSGCGCS